MQKPRVLSGSYTAWARESGPTQKKPFAGIAGAAKQRNPQAMFNLGVSYYNGDGVSADPTLAYAWFLLAQEAGNAAAGDAVKRSAAEGERLGVTSDALQQAAEMYLKGDDLQQSDSEAAKWFDMASKRGQPQAMMTLAEMYWKGDGVGVDRPEAYYLFFLARRTGMAEAKTRAQTLWLEMSKEEIKHLEKKLRELRFDPQKVFDSMQDQSVPNPAQGSGHP
jgi:TPR repeat protein